MMQIFYLKSLLLPMFSSLKFLPLLQRILISSNPHSAPGIVAPCDSVFVNHSKRHPLLEEQRRAKSRHQSLLRVTGLSLRSLYKVAGERLFTLARAILAKTS